MYEVKRRSRRSRVLRSLAIFFTSLVLSAVYLWVYVSVLEWELPKTVLLKKENAQWRSRMEVLDRHLDVCDESLVALQMRDDDIYRSIFGMHEIPAEIRNAGFGGVNRYEHLEGVGKNEQLRNTVMRLDVLTKKSYVQSKSFDEVAQLSRRAGEMIQRYIGFRALSDSGRIRLREGPRDTLEWILL